MNAPATAARSKILAAPVSLPVFILVATTIHVFAGLGALCAWHVTGKVDCVEIFFLGPGGFFLVALALFEFFLARMVMRQFSGGEPLQPAWFLIALSAGCHLAGVLCVQVLSVGTPLNPLVHARDLWSGSTADAVRRFGLIMGGPFRTALLAGGLLWTLRVCRQCRILRRLSRLDWVLLSLVGLCALAEALTLASEARTGDVLNTYDMLWSASVPMLLLLLAEAILLRRSVARMGGGLIAKCWGSYVLAILLTALGDTALWAAACGWVPSLVSSFTWYFRVLAGAAFAMAPAWQVEAIRRARGELEMPRLSVMAFSLCALRLLDPGQSGEPRAACAPVKVR